jgi:hypothetical protein
MDHNRTTARPDPVVQQYLRRCLATAYVPATADEVDSADRWEVERRNLADQMEELAGADAAGRLDAVLEDHGHTLGRTVVAVVGEDGVKTWGSGADLPAGVMPGPLPALGRYLQARQAWIPHAVVLLDRVGADIELVEDRDESDLTVIGGATSHITKSNPGGWSQRRFQQRAEEHWRDNAAKVADQLVPAIEQGGIDLLLVAGDDDARVVLQEVLPDHVADRIVTLDTGGRADDGSEAHLQEAVDAAVRQAASDRRRQAADGVMAAVGQGHGAVGRDDVLYTLMQHRADRVLLHLDTVGDVTAHLGDEPSQVAGDSAVLHTLDLPATRVPLTDAVLSGCAATGAAVVLVDEPLEGLVDGLAASLRG